MKQIARGLQTTGARLRWFCEKNVLRRSLLLREIQGSKMYLDARHPGISRTLAVHGIREAGHTQLIREELSEGMTVVDLGANIGYYTLIEASMVKSGGRVYAVEPDPRNFAVLKKNVEVNGYSDIVETHLMAISDRSGKAEFYLSDATNLNTMLDPTAYASTSHNTKRSIEVEVMSLDDFMGDEKPVNFVRMDIEGYEVEALAGMMKTLRRSRPPCKILFEIHPQSYTEERNLRQPLEETFDLGFRPKVVVSAGEAQPRIFADLGYKPDRTVRDGQFVRGFYYNVSGEDTIELACFLPKSTRYILLEKQE